jgi:hypothetical protein
MPATNFERALVLGALMLAACGVSRRSDPEAVSDAAAASADAAEAGRAGTGKTRTRDKPNQPSSGSTGTSGKGDAGSGAGGSGSGGQTTDLGSDAEDGGAGQISMGEPIETTFVIRNDGEAALLLGSNCGDNWLTLSEQGQPVAHDSTCSCECGAVSNACQCGFICRYTEEVIVPGKSATRTWDGNALDFPANDTCYVKRVPESGSQFEARGCWNVYDDKESCSAVPFAYGSDTSVAISAKADPPAATLSRIMLTNATEGPIQVVKAHCGLPGWFELDMGMQLSIHDTCACPCEDGFKPGACPTCGACAEDEIETLAPGESIWSDWDGQFSYQYESGCSKRYAMPKDTNVMVRLCWTKSGETAPTCRTPPFRLGEGFNLMASD